MSRGQPLCPTSPRGAAMARGTRQTRAARKDRRGGQNAATSALPHSKNRRGRMSMKTKDNDNISLGQSLCSTSPRGAAMARGTCQRHAATKGRRGGQNAPTSALLRSKNLRGRMSMKTNDKYNLSVRQKLLKGQTPVILSAAKDLRSLLWFDDLRTTAEILRCAQDDSCAFRDHRGEQT
jgi:hypothetical protein